VDEKKVEEVEENPKKAKKPKQLAEKENGGKKTAQTSSAPEREVCKLYNTPRLSLTLTLLSDKDSLSTQEAVESIELLIQLLAQGK